MSSVNATQHITAANQNSFATSTASKPLQTAAAGTAGMNCTRQRLLLLRFLLSCFFKTACCLEIFPCLWQPTGPVWTFTANQHAAKPLAKTATAPAASTTTIRYTFLIPSEHLAHPLTVQNRLCNIPEPPRLSASCTTQTASCAEATSLQNSTLTTRMLLGRSTLQHCWPAAAAVQRQPTNVHLARPNRLAQPQEISYHDHCKRCSAPQQSAERVCWLQYHCI